MQISYIDSWFLSLPPVRYLLLRSIQSKQAVDQKPKTEQLVYAFGDSYDFRKSLHITNLLTG
jgi:ATPase complex subunit ATP10